MDIETRINRLEERFEKINQRVLDIEVSVALADDRYNRILTELEKVKESLEKLTEQPSQRWDKAVAATITAIIGGVVGMFISKIGG